MSSCSRLICWKDCSFSTEVPLLKISYLYLCGLFQNSLICSIYLIACLDTSTTVSWLLSLNNHWTQIVLVFQLCSFSKISSQLVLVWYIFFHSFFKKKNGFWWGVEDIKEILKWIFLWPTPTLKKKKQNPPYSRLFGCRCLVDILLMYQNLAACVYEQKNEVFLMLFQFASYFSPLLCFFPHVLN